MPSVTGLSYHICKGKKMDIPEEVKKKAEEAIQGIIDGEVTVRLIVENDKICGYRITKTTWEDYKYPPS